MKKPPPLKRTQIEGAKKADAEIKEDAEARGALVGATFIIIFAGIGLLAAVIGLPILYFLLWPHTLTQHLFSLLLYLVVIAMATLTWWIILRDLKKYFEWKDRTSVGNQGLDT